jgi:cytochrome c-type biogenesis protein CcmF
LGWGGYWGWDPVENSSLIPWLTGTALLHSLIMQRRRNAFRTWTLWLVSLTFALCLFATFITRSGIIQSVHAFGSSPIGYYFLAFIALSLLAVAALMSLRRGQWGEGYGVQALVSRESGFLLSNLLLLGAALAVLVGTLFPALLELFRGQQAALDTAFYERTVGPLALATIALLGVCPWLTWAARSPARLRRGLLPAALIALAALGVLLILGIGEPVALFAFSLSAFVIVSLVTVVYLDVVGRRNRTGEGVLLAFQRTIASSRRRYGAHTVHLGIVLIAVGITGSSVYQDELQVALSTGETIEAYGYTIQYRELIATEMPDRDRFVAVVDLRRGDRLVSILRPEKSFHWNVEQWVTEVAVHTTLKEDLYVVLSGFESDGLASLGILVNPLVVWLWIGGVVLMLGGVMAWWPTAADRKRPAGHCSRES